MKNTMKNTMKQFMMGAVAVLAMGFGAASAARANDGGISFGGSPMLLSGHPSVQMESEKIVLNVGTDTVTVDCRFVFLNSGKACTARMGFPDRGVGANDPDEEHSDDWNKRPPVTQFSSFKSWVDGKATPTKLIRSSQPGEFWHAKTVRFAANSRTIVRDLYTVSVGGGFVGSTKEGGAVSGAETSYILHTGASWHGPIGRSEVIVKFNRSGMHAPLVAMPGEPKVAFANQPYAVYYTGPCEPTVEGKTLTFVRTNWRPREKDDIYLSFLPNNSTGR